MLRSVRTVVAAAVLVIAVSACADSSGSRAPSPVGGRPSSSVNSALTVRTYTPYRAPDVAAVPVTAQASGQCWTGSITVPDPSAYRCFAGNSILDPCFAPPSPAKATSVLCVADPWSAARMVKLTQPLPARGPLGDTHRYWALELANGVHCVVVTGTVPTIQGVPMEYVCGSGWAAGALRYQGSRLIARYGSLDGDQLRDVGVRVAWRG